jgi:hypothetical protein
VNNLKQSDFSPGKRNLPVEPLQRLLHRRHIRLKVYGFDGVALGSALIIVAVPARIVAALVEPPPEAVGKRIGFLHRLSMDDFSDEFTPLSSQAVMSGFAFRG